MQRVDAGPHRRRDDEREEDEREQDAQLPEREREDDDAADDDSDDEGPPGCVREAHREALLPAGVEVM